MWMVMRRKWMLGLLLLKAFEVLVLAFLFMPAARAADADAAEAVDLSAVRAAIDAEPDLELRDAMKEELELLESRGVESLLTDHDRAGSAPELIGPPVEGTGGGGNYLPPAARAELEQIFSQGTGDPSKDGHLREQAEKVMEKYGIEHAEFGNHEGKEGEMTSPREAFQQWEGSEQGQRTDSATREQYREMSEQYQAEFEQRGEGFERAMTEHMAPEAREQMERQMMEAPTHEYEAPTHEYEAATREYEAPTHEYEAPTRESETQTREYEAPTHEYEAPTYEAPTHEYEAPGPGDGSGMEPH